jgi:hypothetical protein
MELQIVGYLGVLSRLSAMTKLILWWKKTEMMSHQILQIGEKVRKPSNLQLNS